MITSLTIYRPSVQVTLLFLLVATSNAQTVPPYAFQDLDTGSAGFNSSASAINNLNQIVGSSEYLAFPGLTLLETQATLWNAAGKTRLYGPGSSAAYAINDLGQIAGYASPAQANASAAAYVWNGAGSLGVPFGAGGAAYLNSSSARGINQAGQVVGSSICYTFICAGASGVSATHWNGTAATYFGGVGSQAAAINSSGQIVGQSGGRAALWAGTMLTDLGAQFGTVGSFATAINGAGQVVGYSSPTTGWRPILWVNGVGRDLGTFAGAQGAAYAINSAGSIVGTTFAPSGNRATLWNGTSVIDLNSLLSPDVIAAGWSLISASGINDNGWIVGSAFNSILNVTHAFAISPVPEPTAYVTLLGGLFVLTVLVRRRT